MRDRFRLRPVVETQGLIFAKATGGSIKRGWAPFLSFLDMKKHWSACVLVFAVLGLASTAALAVDYTFTGTSFPVCSAWGGWSSNAAGTIYTCNESVSLAKGDNILTASAITVVANAGMTLAGQNKIGSAAAVVNLQTGWGNLSISDGGSSSVVYGNLVAGSGSILIADVVLTGNVTASSGRVEVGNSKVSGAVATTSGAIRLDKTALTGNISATTGNVTLANASTVTGGIGTSGWLDITGGSVGGDVSANNGVMMAGGTVFKGSVTSTNGSVVLDGGSVAGSVTGNGGDIFHYGVRTTNGTVIGGNVTANSGPISLSGGSVTGSVHSNCCTIATNYTNIGGSLSTTVISSSHDTITINGGTVSGAISTSGGSGIIISNATVTSGSISTTNVNIQISNSTIGSLASPVNISGTNLVTLSNNTTVYGNVTAANWGWPWDELLRPLRIDNTSRVYGDCSPDHTRCNLPLPGPDHYEISVPTTSISCVPSTVTVTACADSSNPCTSTATAISGSASLSTTGGTLSSPVALTAGVGTAVLSYPTAPDNTAVTVSLSAVTPAARKAVQCRTGAGCSTTFYSAGLIISDSVGGAAANIGTQTAGTISKPYYLRAVRSKTSNKACEAALVGSKTVNWAYQCNNPATCSSSDLMAINSTVVKKNDNGSALSYSPVSMTFDAAGNAPFTINFNDVGQTTLFAKISASGSLLTTISGNSNAFVTKPDHFDIKDIKQTALPKRDNPKADSATGAVFVKAGEAFGATVTAMTSSGVATPNFGRESPPEGVSLTQALFLPSDGVPGGLNNATLEGGTFSLGVAMPTNLSWSEVGIITLTPKLAEKKVSGVAITSYLGGGDVTGSATGVVKVGRFIPDHFAITAGAVSPACGPFTYFSQDGFTTAFTLTAQNSASEPTTTTNYTGDFAKLVLTDWSVYSFAVTPALPAGATLSASSTPPSGNWVKGVAAVSAKHQISRPGALAGETLVKLTALPKDSDGVTMASASAVQTVSTPLRYGRLKLANAFGSELLDLPLGLRFEYWAGPTQGWQANTLDNCTAIKSTDFAFVFPADAKNFLAACETKITVAGSAPNYTATLAAPGKGNAGWADVRLNLGATASGSQCSVIGGAGPAAGTVAAPWLQFKWNSPVDADPVARATFGFGVFNKTGPIINRREMY